MVVTASAAAAAAVALAEALAEAAEAEASAVKGACILRNPFCECRHRHCYHRLFPLLVLSTLSFLPACTPVSSGVYRVSDAAGDEIQKEVAIKILKNGLSLESQCDFEREIEILSSFNHPNIIRLLGIFRSDGKRAIPRLSSTSFTSKSSHY